MDEQQESGYIDHVVRVIRDVGFPMAVAGILLWFLLTKVVPSTDQLTKAIQNNTEAIISLKQMVEQTSHQANMKFDDLQKALDRQNGSLSLLHEEHQKGYYNR